MLERRITHYCHIITHLQAMGMGVGIMGIMECLMIPLLPPSLTEEEGGPDNPGC
jgi:hypothetical protein